MAATRCGRLRSIGDPLRHRPPPLSPRRDQEDAEHGRLDAKGERGELLVLHGEPLSCGL